MPNSIRRRAKIKLVPLNWGKWVRVPGDAIKLLINGNLSWSTDRKIYLDMIWNTARIPSEDKALIFEKVKKGGRGKKPNMHSNKALKRGWIGVKRKAKRRKHRCFLDSKEAYLLGVWCVGLKEGGMSRTTKFHNLFGLGFLSSGEILVRIRNRLTETRVSNLR